MTSDEREANRKGKAMMHVTDQLEPQETAELLTVLERGYQRSYEAARRAWRTPEHHSRLQLAHELDQLSLDEHWATFERGVRQPGEPAGQFRARAYRELDREAE